MTIEAMSEQALEDARNGLTPQGIVLIKCLEIIQ